eukprot:Sspe_Gene.84690::Locus_55595_Transcript_1_1_Confidence_1.000_Length_1105::g.84690::m.84690/K10967/KTR1_3; alpha 1,2-mannosyltransferase
MVVAQTSRFLFFLIACLLIALFYVAPSPYDTEWLPQAVLPKPVIRHSKLHNGVVVFLDSERKPVLKALRLLHTNFLSCWGYDVHIFKENLNDTYRAAVEKATTSRVSFTEVDFTRPHNNIHPDTITYWIKVLNRGRGHHFGYRMMCRFFAGAFLLEQEALRKYDYYWRLDTDSWIRKQIKVDPFAIMHSKGCLYGYHDTPHRDIHTVTERLLDYTLEWAQEYGMPEGNVSRMMKQIPNRSRLPMYYNNFEIARTSLLLSDPYRSFFQYLDSTDGFMKTRWGDAPVRTLAVLMMTAESERCGFRGVIPYVHGRYKDHAEKQDSVQRPPCPGTGRDG